MNLYAVFCEDGLDDDLRQRIGIAFPDNYILSDELFVVSAPQVENPARIADALGLFKDGEGNYHSSGVVLRLNGSFSGYYRQALWDLLGGSVVAGSHA